MKNYKKIKNIILAGASSIALCATTAGAVENIVKISSVIEVQAVHYQNNGEREQEKVSAHKDRYGLYSSGNFALDYKLVSDNGFSYGTKIGIEQSSRNDRAVPLEIYVESDYGRIEVGSGKSAGKKMRITGYQASCGGGNGWDAYVITSANSVPYITNFCSFLDSKMRTNRLNDYSRKVTYFTPKLGSKNHNIQVGISYAPDTSNAGHAGIRDNILHTPIKGSSYKFAVKDGISYGIQYEGQLGEDFSTKISFVGERGKPVAYQQVNGVDVRSSVKFKDLNTYNIGGEVKYKDFSVSASYMDYDKSLTSTTIDKDGRNTSLFALGGKYNFCEKYSASLNYFHSKHKKNKLNATSVGLDYAITQGVKSYAQLTYYDVNGFDVLKNKNEKSKGTVALLGAKISL